MCKRVLITGSNRGIGWHIASRFHSEGCSIISLNRSMANESWLGEIPCDLTNRTQTVEACQAGISALGGIDVCVLNAAIRRFASVERTSDEDWDQTMETNLSSVFRISRKAIPYLMESRGHLIIIGSHAADHYFEGGASYCCSKAALKALCEVIVLETRTSGMRTTLVSPGAVKNRIKSNDDKKIDPSTLAQIVYHICSIPSDAMVGEIEVRPTIPLASPISGLKRLQYL